MFFQIDDQLPNNAKIRALTEMALDEDLRGPAAIGMWTVNGAQCQATLTDGIVTRRDALRIFLHAGIVDMLAAELVRVGLWHGPGHDCARCAQPPAGAWIYHDWFDLGYDRADQVTVTRRKRRELKDQKLINAVWARDCVDPAAPTEAACRYCGELVRRKDTRSKGRRPHLDHVDPTRADGARNIVIACEDCNRRKGNRTPEQADMVLRDEPRPLAAGTGAPAEPPRTAPSRPPAAPRGAATAPAAASSAGTDEAVSPGHADAETRRSPLGSAAEPAPTHATRVGHTLTVSPGTPDAGTHHASPGHADAGALGSPLGSDAGPADAATSRAGTVVSPGHADAGTHTVAGPVPARRDSPGTPDAGSRGAGTDQAAPADHASTTARPRETTRGPIPGQSPSPPATRPRPRADHDPDHASGGIPARATRASAGQAGSGQGVGWGPGKGPGTAGSPPAGPAPSERSRRRRRRGRGTRTHSSTATPPSSSRSPEPPAPHHPPRPDPSPRRWDAGHAPAVPTSGRFGSPWHGWRGPPSTVTETTCPEHELPDPCRRCAETTGDADA